MFSYETRVWCPRNPCSAYPSMAHTRRSHAAKRCVRVQLPACYTSIAAALMRGTQAQEQHNRHLRALENHATVPSSSYNASVTRTSTDTVFYCMTYCNVSYCLNNKLHKPLTSARRFVSTSRWNKKRLRSGSIIQPNVFVSVQAKQLSKFLDFHLYTRLYKLRLLSP